jgi:TetR/AcrR family transcriptional regulator, regulator of cefoperazone and chloramphenicol sensitivity
VSAQPKIIDRSAETRQRLIEAALDLFGAQGFEGTTTRQLALKARVNLAAIPYHFGSKEKLYRAVAEHIVEGIRMRVLAGVGPLPLRAADPKAAREGLHRLLGRVAEILTGSETDRFARFILRELMTPTADLEIFYRGVVEPVQGQICALIAAATGRAPDERAVRLQGVMLFGQIAIFRLAQPIIRRHLGCKTIGTEERARIKRLVQFNLDAILDAGGSP